jgi:hypothetical protein
MRRAGETRDDFIVMQLAHFSRAMLHHRLPQAHLPVAHDDNFAAVTNRQYGRAMHHF